jgi:hypothetical protein
MSKQALNDVVDLQAPVSILAKADIPKHDKYIVEQHYSTIYPTNAGPFSYTGTQDVIFEFDSQNELLDMSRSYVEFEYVSLGATVCLDADAHSVFSRMTLGTERDIVLQDCPGYNIRHTAEKINSVGADFCNTHWQDWSDNLIKDESAKTQLVASTAYRMTLIPDMPIVAQQKILHLPVLGGLRYTLTCEQWENIVSSAHASATGYQIQNVKYHLFLIKVDNEYLGKLRQAVAQGELIYNFADYQFVKNEDYTGAVNNIKLSPQVASLFGVLARFVLSADIGDKSKKYLTKSQLPTALTEAYLQIGSEEYPRGRLVNTSQCYESILDLMALRHDGQAETLQTRAKWIAADANSTFAATPTFFLGINLAGLAGMNDGVSTYGARPQLIVKNTTMAVLADVFLFHSRTILFQSDLAHKIAV